VRALVEGRTPLFEFVIRATLRSFDLDRAEGRVGALRAAVPVVAGIRDRGLRMEYARLLAGWLGMGEESVREAVTSAVRSAARSGADGSGGGPQRGEPGRGDSGRGDSGRGDSGRGDSGRGDSGRGGSGRGESPRDARGREDARRAPAAETGDRMPLPDRRDPIARTERTVLEVVLQHPALVPEEFDDLAADAFSAPAYRAVHEAVRAAGGLRGAREALAAAGEHGGAAWVEQVQEEAAAPVTSLVTELAVAPLPEDRPEVLPDYVRGIVRNLVDIGMTRAVAEVKGRLQRMDSAADPVGYQQVWTELIALENRRRAQRSSV